MPSCDKKVCGDDGCGGTCGSCGEKEGCVEGTCKQLADPDKCAAAKCDANAYCVAESGAAKCVCKMGWVGDGFSCVDENECKKDNGGCPANALCENVVGAPRKCVCTKGYEGNGYVCADVDECKAGTAKCGEHSVCVNEPGTWSCKCDEGYADNGSKGCQDVDECKAGNVSCPENSHCVNTSGSHACACDEGFSKVNGACADVDECASGAHNCDKNATCSNTKGSFQCACKAGWEGDGTICSEKDLCKNVSCHPKAGCSKGASGQPQCTCKLGYDGDGKACYPVQVKIGLVGAVIRPRPSHQACWDPGCSVTEDQMKAIKDAVADAAKAFNDPYVQAGAYALKFLPVEKAMAGVAGKYSKPDVKGTVKLLPTGATLTLPNGGTAEDTLTPKWSGKSFGPLALTSLTGLQVDLDDSDLGTDDPIGAVKVSSSMLLKALQIGKIVPIPTHDQGAGDILFVLVQVDQVQKCGDFACNGTETKLNCSLDCGSGGGNTGGGGGSCAGKCGKYDQSWSCQCDAGCEKFGDCCADLKAVCP